MQVRTFCRRHLGPRWSRNLHLVRSRFAIPISSTAAEYYRLIDKTAPSLTNPQTNLTDALSAAKAL
jgi:hypothetical protein